MNLREGGAGSASSGMSSRRARGARCSQQAAHVAHLVAFGKGLLAVHFRKLRSSPRGRGPLSEHPDLLHQIPA